MTTASEVCAQLSLRFDVGKLVEAYLRTRALYDPVTHLAGHDGRSYHEGWQGVSLRSNAGKWADAGPGGPGPAPFRDTEVVDRVPFWRDLLDAFRCAKESVRISVLEPSGTIIPHCDDHVGFEFGRLRLHVPILTSDAAVMEIAGQRMCWQPGELWFGDFRQVHTVKNRGAAARVHLVLDLQLNEWLLGLFPAEFLARRSIVVYPELCAVTHDLSLYQCRFAIPEDSPEAIELLGALDLLTRERLGDVRGPIAAELVAIDDSLTLALNGEPAFALDPQPGERFRMCGWPLRYELQLVRHATGVATVRFAGGGRVTAWETT
jgi:hypothetical protein